MARPKKCRRVCCLPREAVFVPQGAHNMEDIVVLTVDEFETIRLIDREGLSQEECSTYMNVARTTVQQIYNTARKKLAKALVEGLPFCFEGGDYCLCSGDAQHCGRRNCWRRRFAPGVAPKNEGGNAMIAAIPLDEEKKNVCVSFGRAPYFLFHDIDTGAEEIKVNPAAEAQHGAGLQAAQFVVDSGAKALLTVRCGENAAEVFQGAEVAIYKTEGESAAENLAAFREGKLNVMTHFHAGFHGVQ